MIEHAGFARTPYLSTSRILRAIKNPPPIVKTPHSRPSFNEITPLLKISRSPKKNTQAPRQLLNNISIRTPKAKPQMAKNSPIRFFQANQNLSETLEYPTGTKIADQLEPMDINIEGRYPLGPNTDLVKRVRKEYDPYLSKESLEILQDEISTIENFISCKIGQDELDKVNYTAYKTLIKDLYKKVSGWAENQNSKKAEFQAKKLVNFKDILFADKNFDGYKELLVNIFDNEYSQDVAKSFDYGDVVGSLREEGDSIYSQINSNKFYQINKNFKRHISDTHYSPKWDTKGDFGHGYQTYQREKFYPAYQPGNDCQTKRILKGINGKKNIGLLKHNSETSPRERQRVKIDFSKRYNERRLKLKNPDVHGDRLRMFSNKPRPAKIEPMIRHWIAEFKNNHFRKKFRERNHKVPIGNSFSRKADSDCSQIENSGIGNDQCNRKLDWSGTVTGFHHLTTFGSSHQERVP
jgi:hypothetical protein